MTLSNLTVCMSVYQQPLMLADQLAALGSYDDEVLERLKVIVVDDCGTPPVDPEHVNGFVGLDVELYRILEDVPWNQPMGRNLAMEHAPPGWCLMIDPDMVFPQAMMRKLMTAATKLRRRQVLKFGLRHMNDGRRPVDMSSPNTYLIHRDDFFAVGGYDEDYCGHKGWSDVQLLDVLRAHFEMHSRKDIFADFYSTEQIADAAVHSLDRRTAHNKKIRVRKATEARKAGGWTKWVKRHKGQNLRLPWARVSLSS